MPLKSKDLAIQAAKAALEKKALDVTVLDLSGLTVIADYFVICSGESTTQVKAVAEFIEQEFAQKRIRPLGVEGAAHSHWILLDYGDVIIHVFEKETRAYYNLEKLWMDAKAVEINEDKIDMAGKNKRAIHP
ncbi:MAG: ribosome silencing factor [Thermodesulfovibrionales bacterium]